MKRNSLFFVAPQQIELRSETLAAPGPGEVQARSLCSVVSAGTELLLYKGEAPESISTDAALPALAGKLAYPLKYGYSMVARVEALGAGVDSTWQGRRVFAFNPHESAFNARVEDLQPVPEGCSEEDAAFLPSMETAVNLILDGAPRLGERVVVLGQGTIGLLTTALLSRHPLDSLLAFDHYELRRKLALDHGAHAAYDPAAAGDLAAATKRLGPRNADLVYELTGRPETLDLAINLVGEHGRIVVGSWYGQRRAPVDLGAHFHRGRLTISSSQVSQIEPALRGRWDRQRRFETAWKMLAEVQPSRLITHRFPFEKAGEAYQLLVQRPQEACSVLLTYAQ